MKRKKYTGLVSILVLFFLRTLSISDLMAEGINYFFEHFSISEGLSNSVVNDIYEDKFGFIWIATNDGLNRFNGYDFYVYRKVFKDSTSLNSSTINSIFSDSKGRLWAATSSGLNLYQPESDNFISVISNLNINSINEDTKGNIILGCDGGIRIIESLEDEVRSFTVHDGLPVNRIDAVYRDRKGNILCINGRNLIQFYPTERRIKNLYETDSIGFVLGISKDVQGFLWLCTSNKLIKLDPDNGYRLMDSISLKKVLIKKEGLKHFLIDSRNNFWIGDEKGLYNYDLSSKQLIEIKVSVKGVSYTDNWPTAFYEDKIGNIWIGLYGKGIFANLINQNSFKHFRKIEYYENSLRNNIVTCFAEDKKKNIWVGTWGGGLHIFNPVDESILRYSFKDKNMDSWTFRSLYFEDPSALWAVTDKNGIIKLDINSNTHIHYKLDNFADINFYSVFKSGNGNLYFGTSRGILVFDKSKNYFIELKYNHSQNSVDKIQFVRMFTEDKYGNTWIGTHGYGLFRITRNDEITQFAYDLKRSTNEVNNNIIYYLLEDKRGLLWIGTMGGGLNIYNPSINKFFYITDKNGLQNNIVNGILEEGNNLWISTNNGLSKFEIPGFIYSDTLSTDYFDSYDFRKHFYYFDPNDGLQSKEFKYASCFKSSTDQLYFGGVNGFNSFNPKEIRFNSNPPEPIITDFFVHNIRQLPNQEDSPLDSIIFDEKEIRLKHYQNFFSLEFLAINYTNPQKSKYRYILKGFDTDWTEATSNRLASYTNVNPGEYIFMLDASNNDGVWAENMRKIHLIIEPSLFGRIWFQVIVVLILFGILFSFYRYRLYLVKQYNISLEKKVSIRTEQLKESNRQLEAQKNEILEMSEKLHQSDQLKLRFLTNISHDFRTPLTLILGPLEKLMSGNEILGNTRLQLSYAYKNALKLLNLINELLDFRKLDTGNIEIKLQEINIVKFINSILSFYEQHAKQRKIDFTILTDSQDVKLWIDPNLMEKVFSNLLSNSFKYTPDGGQIIIRINEYIDSKESMVRILFEDNGEGISDDQLNLIFNRFYHIEKPHKKNQQYGSGIGLALCKEYIELHQGMIRVERRETGGSRFIINLKKGTNHLSEEQYKIEKSIVQEHEFNLVHVSEILADTVYIPEQQKEEKRPRILVIEDNKDIQAYIFEILKDEYYILVASNGEEGLKKAVENIPDLILLDIMIPGINGLKLGNQLKEDQRTNHIPIIILSALASEEDKLMGFEAGADDYIVKPFSEKILKSRIKLRIEKRRKLINRFKDDPSYNFQHATTNVQEEEFLKKIIEVLDNNISDENFKISSLSKEMNLSRTHLLRKISAITGKSTMEFVRSYKMQEASKLLLEGKYNISEVAYKLGFKTLPHFTRTFISFYKISPRKFMQEKNDS